MTILGIDEAGRGPVIGPLVLCGYLIDEDAVSLLADLSIKDSKQLSPQKRTSFFPQLKKIARATRLISVSAKQIDAYRGRSNLNKLEIEHMRALICDLKPDTVIIDAPEVNTRAFTTKIRSGLTHLPEQVICENDADKTYPAVAAASILAKVTRDRAITRLHRMHGFFGSGYTSDERTITFLKNWIQVNNTFPSCVRTSWVTIESILHEKQQKTMRSFIR